MKRFQQQFSNQAKRIQLSDTERRDLRERLSSYMEYHPLPASVAAKAARKRHNDTALVAPVSVEQPSFVSFNIPYLKALIGTSLVVVFITVPVMAERALPGDILYSVKVTTEEFRSTLSRDPYQQIEWETERLNRRLSEAQTLVRDGRMTEEQEERVAQAVRTHSDAARASIERLRADDADEAAMAEIALSALFDVHSAVLSAHSPVPASLEERRMVLAGVLESEREQRSDSERPSYAGLLARIELESARAYEILSTIAQSASDEELESIVRRLDDIERKVQAGVGLHEEGNDSASRTTLSEALASTRKVMTFMSNIDVRSSVKLDMLVPVEYTKEELTDRLTYELQQIESRYEHIRDDIESIEDELVREKVDPALTDVESRLTATQQQIEEAEFSRAGESLLEIDMILDDVEVLGAVQENQRQQESLKEQATATSQERDTTNVAGQATSSDRATATTSTSTPGQPDDSEETANDGD